MTPEVLALVLAQLRALQPEGLTFFTRDGRRIVEPIAYPSKLGLTIHANGRHYLFREDGTYVGVGQDVYRAAQAALPRKRKAPPRRPLCKRGHPKELNRRGEQWCRTCKNAQARKRRRQPIVCEAAQ